MIKSCLIIGHVEIDDAMLNKLLVGKEINILMKLL